MTPLVERLADLREQLDHLREVRPEIDGPGDPAEGGKRGAGDANPTG